MNNDQSTLLLEVVRQGFSNLYWILGAASAIIIPLLFGSYLYTWITTGRIWNTIQTIQSNHLAHISERLKKLEGSAGPGDKNN